MKIGNWIVVCCTGLLFLLPGCKKEKFCDSKRCGEELQLEIPVLASANCEYWYDDGENELSFEIIGVNEHRERGELACMASQGGYAEIHVVTKLNDYMTTTVLTWRGCAPEDREFEVENNGAPSYGRANYIFRLLKLFPASRTMETNNEQLPLEEYSFRMVLIKN